MDNIVIKEMSIDDYERVISLWIRSKGVGISEDDSRGNISDFLDRNVGLSLIAETKNQIMGAVLCGHDGRRGYIYHLAVDEKYRRTGLGKKIINECLSRLYREKITKCHLFVFKDNISGTAFWTNTGWKIREELNIMSKNISKVTTQ